VSGEKSSLSVIVITRNEERNIEACLESVAWADDIVVLDSQSTDRTVELALTRTPKVHVVEWKGYAGTKQAALALTVHEWVLWLDADERVTTELAAEIRSVVASPPEGIAGYEVGRRAFFIGKWIKHCGWYPGYVVRLFRKTRGSFSASRVHEGLVLSGSSGRLRGDLLHFTDETLYHYFEKFNRYTTLAAEEILARGGSFSLYDLIVRPPFLFVKMYLLRGGFLDGLHGLVLSLASAAYVFCKYAKCWDLERMAGDRAVSRN
jgi:glycosyltransferase involved in cell wall biosynthesis